MNNKDANEKEEDNEAKYEVKGNKVPRPGSTKQKGVRSCLLEIKRNTGVRSEALETNEENPITKVVATINVCAAKGGDTRQLMQKGRDMTRKGPRSEPKPLLCVCVHSPHNLLQSF